MGWPGRKFVFTNGSRKHAEAVAARLGVLDRFEDIFDIHALEYIHPKPSREAYERFVKANGVVLHHAAMFDDLPHNLETAHRLGMTTVLVDGMTDHPEHQAIAGWTELPAHIHHRTDALAPFLAAVGAALAQEKDRSSAAPLQAQFCLTWTGPAMSHDHLKTFIDSAYGACRRDHARDQGRRARRGGRGARSSRQRRAQGRRKTRRRMGRATNG